MRSDGSLQNQKVSLDVFNLQIAYQAVTFVVTPPENTTNVKQNLKTRLLLNKPFDM